ncbi:MAG: hypothetical protein C0490_04385, partial [Marivirga sp.]|nr:hypothetical protein [Marivirga sp.]
MRNYVSTAFLIQFFIACTLLLQIGCSSKKNKSATLTDTTGIQVQHPLDPLNETEIKTVKQLLFAEHKIDSTYRFFVINLKEPPKAEIMCYKPGQPYRREAFAVLYNWSSNSTFETVVDLVAKKVRSFDHIAGVTAGGLS